MEEVDVAVDEEGIVIMVVDEILDKMDITGHHRFMPPPQVFADLR